MRMRKIVQKNTLREYADKFLSYKKAQKVSQRTYKDYQKYLDDFIEKSQNSTDIESLKDDILVYFGAIPLTSLDSNQIYFVNQIVEYIVHNGLMKDLSVLQDAPFTDNGSIVEVFTDLTLWIGIKRVIDRINANAIAA